MSSVFVRGSLRIAVPLHVLRPFVDGAFLSADSTAPHRPLIDPALGGAPFVHLQCARVPEDVDHAVSSARVAQPSWANWPATQRRDILWQIADRIQSNSLLLAQLETLCGGKPLAEAKQDMIECTELFRFYAGFCDKIQGRQLTGLTGRYRASTRKSPLGVVVCITSYNYPLLLICWKLAPALACGNAVIVKPADQTPLSALLFADLIKDLLPKGILNVLPSADPSVGQYLCHHPDIDKISFTGSGPVGRQVLAASAQSNLKRVTLELGGKSPLIVFPDAVLDKAVEDVFGALFTNSGENCCAGSRLLIHRSIYEPFLEKLKQRVLQVRIGDPFDEQFNFGPVVDQRQYQRVCGFIERARQDTSIQSLIPGEIQEIASEEIFGPVLTVLKPFDSMEEVIQRANRTPFGLAAGVWTQNLQTAEHCIESLQAGTVWINTYNIVPPILPFGGIRGASGFGKDMGDAALDEYTNTKSVMIDLQL